MNCINLSQFIAYQNNRLTTEEYKEISEHIKTCSVCQKNTKEYEQFLLLFKKSYKRSESKNISKCYNDSDLLNFIESKASQKSQTTFYSHLLECQFCMDRMLSLQQDFNKLRHEGVLTMNESVLDKIRGFISNIVVNITAKLKPLWTTPKVLRPVYGWMGLLLVLCISMIAMITINNSKEKPIITRDNQFEKNQRQVLLIHPENNSQLNIHNTEFKWKAPEEIISYNFFLLDARGNILWETKTKNKQIILPENIILNNNYLYFWRVEALYEDGTSILSPMMSFTNTFD
jgi:hypothetical protein